MAFSSTRAAGKLIPNILKTNLTRCNRKFLLPSCLSSQTNIQASRSIWHLSNSKYSHKHSCNGICCARGMSYNADNDLAKFLNDEIKTEKDSTKPLPEVKGFKVQKLDGAEICLVKKANGETIFVKANVNNSMDDDSEGQDVEGDEAAVPDMVSRPPLVIEITKDGADQTLCVSCDFPHAAENQTGQEEEYVDVIEIREVAFKAASEAEWQEQTYAASGAVLDATMYDLVLSMLEERGVDGNFCDQMVGFATQYEHEQYVSFLEKLQSFVRK